MLLKLKNKLKQEAVFFIVALATAVSCLFGIPSWSAIDWKVIAALGDLMLISLALEEYKLLDKIAVKALASFGSTKRITAAMIATTAVIAMFMTNDVALLTVVPLTIIMAKKAGFDPYRMIILETAAANIGSSLTPFGNPQNLYLYAFYEIPTIQFFAVTLGIVIIGMLLLFAINLFTKNKDLSFAKECVQIKDKRKIATYLILFVLILLSILRVLDYRITTAVTLLIFLLLDRKLFLKVDYFLLGTFILFFLFVDNITGMELIRVYAEKLLTSPLKVLLSSALLSQFISNVPSAILLSGFTKNYQALLLGVSIGGLGTMVASLANLISYKLYCKEYNSAKYNKLFYRMNFILFILLLGVGIINLLIF